VDTVHSNDTVAVDGYNEAITLPGGPRLALRRRAAAHGVGAGQPVLLVHGLSSNARTWDGVARVLAEAGHDVAAVDQRGHGRSEQTDGGYATETCADDLASLIETLGWTGDRAPLVAGQSWGGNVVLDLAARRGGVAVVALVDGGWISLAGRFASFDECWQALAPPVFDNVRAEEMTTRFAQWHPDWSPEAVAGTMGNFEALPDGTVRPWLRREHHRDIVRSLYEADPDSLYPTVEVPVLLVPAVGEPPSDFDTAKRAAVDNALARLPDAQVEWYVGADHDLHCQQPERLAADLLHLAARAGEKRRP
jgi:pimeloyl-ACP methyl ester carboxylesterase